MSQPFLITGMARSGTTLLDKLIGAHPSAMAISQPIPMLYRIIKSEFFKQNGISTNKYVLNDLFEEKRYSRGDLLSFLKEFKISPSTLNETLLSMKGWSGQLTSIDSDTFLENYSSSTLIEFYHYLLKANRKTDEHFAQGTKEILLEEYVEYFLENGVKVILVIRDPRDVITSLNVGKGTEYGGDHRPTLFHLRNWRKSIAIANTFEENSNCLVIRYEDLVNKQDHTLSEITKFLNISPYEIGFFDKGIPSANGEIWEGNSSTGKQVGISAASKGKYKKHLSEEMIAYIESLCFLEMKAFGYELESEHSKINYSFKEPFEIKEGDLDPNMSSSQLELDREVARLNILMISDHSPQEIKSVFYSATNYNKLKREY